jgi:hypothetical protein
VAEADVGVYERERRESHARTSGGLKGWPSRSGVVGIPMTSSLAKEGVSVASEQATPTSALQELFG